MFEDDRGRLLQIEEWINHLEEGLISRGRLADEVIWWRLSRIDQCCDRLSPGYRARHPEIAALALPSTGQVLNRPPPSVSAAVALAQRAIATFKPLLASLPPPPSAKPMRSRLNSRYDEVLGKLQLLKPHLREQGLSALYLFGSIARREDEPDSDIDLAFEVGSESEQKFSMWDQSRLAEELREELHSDVDLVEWSSLRDGVRERVCRDMIKVFGEFR